MPLDLQGSFYDDGTFDDHPSAAAFALIERWTGVTIIDAWFLGEKPTFVVQTATP